MSFINLLRFAELSSRAYSRYYSDSYKGKNTTTTLTIIAVIVIVAAIAFILSLIFGDKRTESEKEADKLAEEKSKREKAQITSMQQRQYALEKARIAKLSPERKYFLISPDNIPTNDDADING